jgi:hypothetical protein
MSGPAVSDASVARRPDRSRGLRPYQFIECCLLFMPARVSSSLLSLGTSLANRCLLVCAVKSLTFLRYAGFGFELANDPGKSID